MAAAVSVLMVLFTLASVVVLERAVGLRRAIGI